MQVKLLRVLQDKEVCMVGSTRTQPVDTRILAATNKNLAAMVTKGLFREDLYYRLNVVAIELPPLRERGDDVLLLIDHFTAKYAADAERPAPRFTDAALDLLRRNSWSGNIRALENAIQGLLVMVDGDTIDVSDLPPFMRFAGPREGGLNRSLAEVEAEHVRAVLESVGGNKTRAAEILGIDRKTLREKLRR
jgi:DNA-binding NtrC family response regulator